MICLDTNVVISILHLKRPDLDAKFRRLISEGKEICLPAIVLFELRYGYAKSDRPNQMKLMLERFLSPGVQILPFDELDAAEAGDIRAHLEARGAPIGPFDILIAAQARRRGATLVTLNRDEFSRVPGLAVTDWSD